MLTETGLSEPKTSSLPLSTLAENLLSYGLLDEADDPAFIELELEEKRLYFYVQNRRGPNSGAVSQHPGMNSLAKRLNDYYMGKYTLDISQSEEHFEIRLNIVL